MYSDKEIKFYVAKTETRKYVLTLFYRCLIQSLKIFIDHALLTGYHIYMNHESIETEQNNFEKVIPTAWMVAYRRTFSDIPFSQEIFDKLEAIRKAKKQEIPDELKRPELAPQFEARHKLIDKLILQNKNNQILELAAGFTSRGLSMSKDNDFNYTEVDLSAVISEKQEIVREIVKENNLDIPNNLHFELANVLNYEDLERATTHFDKSKPITIINEGLLRYLTFIEKAQVSRNIHQLLERFGGVWITSDISLRKIFAKENAIMDRHVEKISELTGKDIKANRFETEDEAKNFFEQLGFSIERHSFMEVIDDLTSPGKLNLNSSQVKGVLEDAVVYVMKCA